MSSIYIFGDGEEALAKPDKIIKPVLDKFSVEQAQSLSKLLHSIKAVDAGNHQEKTRFVDAVDKQFAAKFEQNGTW